MDSELTIERLYLIEKVVKQTQERLKGIEHEQQSLTMLGEYWQRRLSDSAQDLWSELREPHREQGKESSSRNPHPIRRLKKCPSNVAWGAAKPKYRGRRSPT